MTRQSLGAIREDATRCYRHSRDWIVQSSVTVRVVLGFFVLAAVLMAFHTALSSRNSSMQLTVQHGFRNANFSMWVDGEVAYTGTLNGSMKKKFGLLPGSVRGSLSTTVPLVAGSHTVKVQVQLEDGSILQDSVAGEFPANTERKVVASTRPGHLSLAWQGTAVSAPSSGSGWFARYAGALFLTIGGSIISALTGFVLRKFYRTHSIAPREDPAPKAQSTAAGQ